MTWPPQFDDRLVPSPARCAGRLGCLRSAHSSEACSTAARKLAAGTGYLRTATAPNRCASMALSVWRCGEEQNDWDVSMVAPHVGKELQCLAVERINAGQNEIDVVPLHQLDGEAVAGRHFNNVAQRFEHRRQKGQTRVVGPENQNTKLFCKMHQIRPGVHLRVQSLPRSIMMTKLARIGGMAVFS